MNPFHEHPTRRYTWAWEQLHHRTGRHLDLGCNRGAFLGALARTTKLECVGVDAHEGYLREAAAAYPGLDLHPLEARAGLSFPDASFSSASLLDVLEHVPDEHFTLSEIRRVLAPGGLLVLSVPALHLFSFLDPDNAKFRAPRLHRWVYSARFGREVYQERFVDLDDGLRGDMSVERKEHTNYHPGELVECLEGHGFQVVDRGGANLFWRWFQVPALLTGGLLRRGLERLVLWDGRLFSRANLFLALERR